MANEIKFRTSVKNDAKKELTGLEKQLDSVGIKSKGATGALGKLGVATGGLVTPTSAVAAGALALAGGMVHATRAAAEEDINIRRLSVALKANVPSWNGMTYAIERQISTSEKLAFSDDDLRDSLARLVGVTHNVNSAFKLQATAMNLARFAHISLEEASAALIKVENGQFRALKGLGINLKDYATQAEAVAAVDKLAAGQADEYAKSLIGKSEAIKIRLGDLEEDFGAKLIPVEADMLDFFNSGIEGWALLADAVQRAEGIQTQAQGENLKELIAGTRAADAARHRTITTIKAETAVLQSQLPVHDTVGSSFVAMTQEMRDAMAATKTDIKSQFKDVTDYAKDRLTSKEIRDILSGKGSLGHQLAKGLKDARPDVRDKWADIQKELLATIDARIRVNITPTHMNPRVRAEGGPVTAGQPYVVGEKRPELFVPDVSGTIIPRVPALTGGGGDNRPRIIQVVLPGVGVIAEAVDKHNARTFQRLPAWSGRT